MKWEAPGTDGDAHVICTHRSLGKRRTIAHVYDKQFAPAIAAVPEILDALGPSEGGTADFPTELEIVADCIDRTDKGCGLGAHLRQRAATIRAALVKAGCQ